MAQFYPLSVAIVGVVVEHLGPAIIFPASGAVLCIAVVFGLFQKELREL